MSKSKTDGDPSETAEAIAVPGLKPLPQGFPDGADAIKPIGPARVFRDKVFTSRTLVLPDGSTVPVAKGQVTAVGDEQFAHFSAHPDLELLQE